jgi:hypothetical protein
VGKTLAGKFVDWLLKGEMPAEYPTYALAHYAGRYDMHFVLGELYRQGGIKPRLIKKGEKLYQVTIERKKTFQRPSSATPTI